MRMPVIRKTVAILVTAVFMFFGGPAPAGWADEEGRGGHVAAIRTVPQPSAANLGAEYRSIRLWPVGDAASAIASALDKRCEKLEFAEMPLREALAAFADRAGISITLDHEAFEDAGLAPETPVTARFAGISFRSALRQLLRDIDLASIIRHDRLVVTTVAKAQAHPVRTFYPTLPGGDLDEIAALIERTIAPATWDTVGGHGTVTPAPTSLGWGVVVNHDEDVQEEIEALLAGCDRAAWQAVNAGTSRPKHVRAYEIDDDVARAQLAEQLVDLCNQALADGGDPDASVHVIGRSLVVQSHSRPFHMMAAHIVAAVNGVVELLDIELEGQGEEPGEASERPAST
jgi:hypothetical protein